MAISLYVWGPGYGLPSIDPPCLAAITYFREVLPPGAWRLIDCSDDTISPTRKLPALQDGDQWVGGLANIIDHLRDRNGNSVDLDAPFSGKERADITAFTSHILTHGPPLLDLHLHVSSENYTTTTRPAYSALLQWPMTWTITPAIHAQAKQRTEHLGLPTLDLHAAGANDPYRSAAGASVIPESLRTTRQSLSGLVKRSETASRFKLEALAARFLKPLESLLGEKQNLMSETEFSSVDCTAFAYLALLLTPQVPQPWLREMIEQRYPGLRNYVDSHKTRCFPGPVNVSDAHRDDQRNPPTGSKDGKEAAQGLPWQKPQPSTLMETVSRFAASAISNPLDVPIIQSGTTTARPGPQATVPLLFGLLGAVSSAGAYLGYAYNEAQRPRHSLSHMGEAGAMLASLDFGAGGAGAAGQRQTVQQEDVTDIVFRRR